MTEITIDKEKVQYAEDEKWMAEPWAAWEVRAPHLTKEWSKCTNKPMFGLDGLDYRRRPDAPEKCCRLCKHRIKHSTDYNPCRVDQRQRDTSDYIWSCPSQFPKWCPLGAEKKQEEEAMAHVYADGKRMPISSNDGTVKENNCPALKAYADDRCSACRHTFEPKPRTIRIEAELPEPKNIYIDEDFELSTTMIKITVKNKQDASAWYDAIKKAMEAK